jgi:hypothetical protein
MLIHDKTRYFMRDITKPGAIKDQILIRLIYANVKIVDLVVAVTLNFQIISACHQHE